VTYQVKPHEASALFISYGFFGDDNNVGRRRCFGGLRNLSPAGRLQQPDHRKCAFLSVDANARAALLATCVPFCRSVLELIQIDTRSSASTKKLAIAVFKSLSAGKISLSNTRPTGFGRVRGHISAPRAEKNYVRFS